MEEKVYKMLCECRLCGGEFVLKRSRSEFLDDVFNWSGSPKTPRLVEPHMGCPKGIGVADVLGLIEEEGDNER